MGLQNVTVTGAMALAGFGFEKRFVASGNDVFGVTMSVPAAKSGSLSTRTDGDTGELTMGGGHGITTGDRLDLYWSGGCRRGITVGTVDGNAVPIDGGAGDDLPAQSTAITAMVPVEASFPLTVADAQAVAVKANTISQFTLCEDDDSESYSFYVEPVVQGQEQSEWWADGFGASPLTETAITKVYLSHGDVNSARTMTAAYLSE